VAPAEKYTKIAVTLHWLIALLIGFNIILGLGANYVPDAFVRPMVDLHKSFGITIIFLFALRLAWRLSHSPPPLPPHYKAWETKAAQLAHIALYLLIIAMPVTGWIHDSAWSGAATHPMKLFWIIPWFRLPFVTAQHPATKETIHATFGAIHTYLSYALYAVLAAHILGALKHQLIDGDPELQRMWK
jgi:cytochrome b561